MPENKDLNPQLSETAVSTRFYSEKDKIKSRIKMAEILAKEEIEKGTDLKPIIKKLIEEESYCGAEGIRRVLQNE